mgnify:CR=1 FL=1
MLRIACRGKKLTIKKSHDSEEHGLNFIGLICQLFNSFYFEHFTTSILPLKYLSLKRNATFTNAINTGTSTNGPITAAKATPELIPKTAMATAMANSKLLLAAVNDKLAVFAYPALNLFPIKKEIKNMITK